jgi:hypothetical protein
MMADAVRSNWRCSDGLAKTSLVLALRGKSVLGRGYVALTRFSSAAI